MRYKLPFTELSAGKISFTIYLSNLLGKLTASTCLKNKESYSGGNLFPFSELCLPIHV